MSTRADIYVARSTGSHVYGGAVNSLVQTPTGVLYLVYVDSNADVSFRKSTDGGLTWSLPVLVSSALSVTQLSIWYDRWSGISAGKIHCAYSESVIDDVFYRSINTESSDALSSEITVFSGASTASGGALSVCAARSGYLYILVCIDAGAESEFARSTDGGGTWDLTRNAAGSFESATSDMWALVPSWNADTNDLMCIFWDASANEISRKLYDSSGDSWSESSISASMNDVAATASFPNFAVAVDLANSQIVLIAWNDVDVANQDLKCWTVSDTAITAKTDVVTNGTDDQALCAIAIDTVSGYWHAFYAGKSDGSETYQTAMNVYCKISQDSGATWGAETRITAIAPDVRWLVTVPRFFGKSLVAYFDNVNLELRVNADYLRPRAAMLVM